MNVGLGSARGVNWRPAPGRAPGSAMLGIVIVGPFALPFTLVSSVAWSVLMWLVRRDAEGAVSS
jgi:hypothetical protein